MAIRGLTDRSASFSELGQLRKGAAKTDPKKPGPDLDYFRFTTADAAAEQAFRETFGDKPREVEFVLPFDSVDENFEAWREEYGAGGLVHRCDGVTCVQWRDERGVMQFSEKPCPTPTPEQRKAGGCKQTARLKVVIPSLKRFAYVTVLTTSIYDILTIAQNLSAIQMINGSLRGVPMILRRTERAISTPTADGKRARYKKWLLTIEPHPQWVERKLLEERNVALGLIEAKEPLMLTTAIADEGDENDDVVHGEVVHDDFDRKAALDGIYKGFDTIRKTFGVSAEDVEKRVAAAAGGEIGEFEDMEDEQLDAILKSLRAWFEELKGSKRKAA